MTLRSFFLFVFTLLCAAAPAMAQDNSLYTVSNVHVDASGASSTEALNAAIAQGRGKAFQTVYRRLTRQAEDFPRRDREGNPIHGPDRSALAQILDIEVADVQQRLSGGGGRPELPGPARTWYV